MKMKQKNRAEKAKKQNKGITLIALVITIIVLLILAGVAIATLTGDNGLLQKAATTKQANEETTELELIKLAVSAAQIEGKGKIAEKNLIDELGENFDNVALTPIADGWQYEGNKIYKIYQNGNVEEVNEILPNEYQQVEFIESSGFQGIDTGISGGNNMGFEINMSLGSQVQTYPQFFAGDQSPAGSKLYMESGYLYCVSSYGGIGKYVKLFHNSNLDKHSIVYKDSDVYLDKMLVGNCGNGRMGK